MSDDRPDIVDEASEVTPELYADLLERHRRQMAEATGVPAPLLSFEVDVGDLTLHRISELIVENRRAVSRHHALIEGLIRAVYGPGRRACRADLRLADAWRRDVATNGGAWPSAWPGLRPRARTISAVLRANPDPYRSRP